VLTGILIAAVLLGMASSVLAVLAVARETRAMGRALTALIEELRREARKPGGRRAVGFTLLGSAAASQPVPGAMKGRRRPVGFTLRHLRAGPEQEPAGAARTCAAGG
jgi:hypothetical protein